MATSRSPALPDLPNPAHQRRNRCNTKAHTSLLAAIHHVESADRADLEDYIHRVFAHGYGADIKIFLPQFLSLKASDGELMATLGMRSGGKEKLFLETYLDDPVEQRLSAVTGLNTQRNQIVEIGNLASTRPGAARWIFLALAAYLHGRGTEWAIYTVAPFLKNTFLKLGFRLHILAKADKARLGDDAKDWGSYYDASPEVMAVRVSQAYLSILHFAESSGNEALLHLCADAYEMGVRSR